jgi:hypothetical protein
MSGLVPTLLRGTARAVPWRPQLACGALALALAADAGRHPHHLAASFDAQLAALVLAAGLVLCAPDRLGPTLSAVPVALWRRRAAAGAVCGLIPCLTWPIVLLAGGFGADAAGVLTLQLLAVAATGLTIGHALPGHEAAVAGGIALALGMARLLSPNATWQAIVAASPTRCASVAWGVLVALGAAALLHSSRDPARRRSPGPSRDD